MDELHVQLNKILQNSHWLNEVNKIQSAFEISKYPLVSYIGINYNEHEVLSAKMFFVTTQKIELNTLGIDFFLMPDIRDRYESYIENKEFSIANVGNTFGVKINNDNQVTYSYFQQIPGYKNLVDADLAIPKMDKQIRDNYYVIEGTTEKAFEKQYLLYLDKINQLYLLNFFGFSEINVNDLVSLEYAHFKSKKKLYVLPISNEKLLKMVYHIDPKMSDIIDFFAKQYSIYPAFPGFYLNSPVKSIYFTSEPCEVNFFMNKPIHHKFAK